MPFVLSKADSILKANITESLWVGLSTTTPNENGGNFSEPSASEYCRVQFDDTFDTTVTAQVSNGKGILFYNETLGSWGTITHFGLFTSKTGGTPIFWGKLTSNVAITAANYVPIFRAGALKIALDREVQ